MCRVITFWSGSASSCEDDQRRAARAARPRARPIPPRRRATRLIRNAPGKREERVPGDRLPDVVALRRARARARSRPAPRRREPSVEERVPDHDPAARRRCPSVSAFGSDVSLRDVLDPTGTCPTRGLPLELGDASPAARDRRAGGSASGRARRTRRAARARRRPARPRSHHQFADERASPITIASADAEEDELERRAPSQPPSTVVQVALVAHAVAPGPPEPEHVERELGEPEEREPEHAEQHPGADRPRRRLAGERGRPARRRARTRASSTTTPASQSRLGDVVVGVGAAELAPAGSVAARVDVRQVQRGRAPSTARATRRRRAQSAASSGRAQRAAATRRAHAASGGGTAGSPHARLVVRSDALERARVRVGVGEQEDVGVRPARCSAARRRRGCAGPPGAIPVSERGEPGQDRRDEEGELECARRLRARGSRGRAGSAVFQRFWRPGGGSTRSSG